MKSMTGHGRGEAAAQGLRVVVECFSVNRKQGEVSLAVGRDLQWMEPLVREEVLKRVSRGKVQVSVVLEQAEGGASGLIDQARAAAFLQEARRLEKKLGLAGGITLETVLNAPGVLKVESGTERNLWPLVKRALGSALEGLMVMRSREGANLKKEISGLITRLAGCVRKVHALAPRVPKRQRENLLRRLEAANLPLDVLEPRVAAEIAVFAERCDITEELTRLESHLVQFREYLTASGPAGRTMEFLTQEMGREWNTIGSKANDAEISRLVVEAKSELDRAREQLANIE